MKKRSPEHKNTTWYLEKLLSQRTRNLYKLSGELTQLLESLSVIPYECPLGRVAFPNYVHKSAKKITGFTSDEFTSDPDFWVKRIHPDDKKNTLDLLNNLSPGEKLSFEYRWQIKDGSYKWFSNYIEIIPTEGGTDSYIHGYWQIINYTKK